MGFQALLVQERVFCNASVVQNISLFFMQTELGFLMVGHTHEDIDQSFSSLSRYLRKHDALNMPGYIIIVKQEIQTVTCGEVYAHAV